MLHFIEKYFINFWIWWYIVNAKLILFDLLRMWSFVLAYFNLIPMLTNLFTPLYQDYSTEGRIIALPIRLTWVVIGLLAQVIVTIPLAIIYLIYLILPLLPIWGIVIYIVKL